LGTTDNNNAFESRMLETLDYRLVKPLVLKRYEKLVARSCCRLQ